MKRLAWFLLFVVSLGWAQKYQGSVLGPSSTQPSALSRFGNHLPLTIGTGSTAGTLIGYWDAHSVLASGISDGGGVASWLDNSPYHHNATQGSGSTAPPTLQIAASTIPYRPSIKFVTTDYSTPANSQFLTVPDDTSLRLTCPFTIYVAADHWTSYYDFLGKTSYQVGDPNTGNAAMSLTMTPSGSTLTTAQNWEINNRTSPRLHSFECAPGPASTTASTGSKYSMNGAVKKALAFNASPTVNTGPLAIGGGSPTYNFGSFSIDAIAIYSGVPTAAERRLIAQYFHNIYKIPYVDPNYDADRACGDTPDTSHLCAMAGTYDALPSRMLPYTYTYQGGNDPGNGTLLTGIDANSATQPNIVYVPAGWNGHKWWLVWTVDFYGSAADEQTNIAFSDNAEAPTPTWTEPLRNGASVNPVTFGICAKNSQSGGCRGATQGSSWYNVTDPELVYSDPSFCDAGGAPCGNGAMYIFNMEQHPGVVSNTDPAAEAIQIVWSTDGSVWRGADGLTQASHTNPPLVATFGIWGAGPLTCPSACGTNTLLWNLSPSVTWDNNLHLWVFYSQHGVSGSNILWRSTTTMAQFPTGWTTPMQVKLDYDSIASPPFHSKIIWDKGMYYMFWIPTSSPSYAGWGTSPDGLTFQLTQVMAPVFSKTPAQSWSDTFLYKGGIYRRDDGNWEVYYGGIHACNTSDTVYVGCSTAVSGYTGSTIGTSNIWRVGHTVLTWPGR